MQLDAVRRLARLSFKIVKKTNASNSDRHIDRLKRVGRGEHRVELRARVRNTGGERTAGGHTTRRWNLCDHRMARRVGDHHVIVQVVHQRVLLERRVDDVELLLGRLSLIVLKFIGSCD